MRGKQRAKGACRHTSLKRAKPFILIRRFASDCHQYCIEKLSKLANAFQQFNILRNSITPEIFYVNLKC